MSWKTNQEQLSEQPQPADLVWHLDAPQGARGNPDVHCCPENIMKMFKVKSEYASHWSVTDESLLENIGDDKRTGYVLLAYSVEENMVVLGKRDSDFRMQPDDLWKLPISDFETYFIID